MLQNDFEHRHLRLRFPELSRIVFNPESGLIAKLEQLETRVTELEAELRTHQHTSRLERLWKRLRERRGARSA